MLRGVLSPSPCAAAPERAANPALCRAAPCCTVLCCVMLCCIIVCHAMPCCAVPCRAVPCCTVPYCTGPCCVVPCNAVPCRCNTPRRDTRPSDRTTWTSAVGRRSPEAAPRWLWGRGTWCLARSPHRSRPLGRVLRPYITGDIKSGAEHHGRERRKCPLLLPGLSLLGRHRVPPAPEQDLAGVRLPAPLCVL